MQWSAMQPMRSLECPATWTRVASSSQGVIGRQAGRDVS